MLLKRNLCKLLQGYGKPCKILLRSYFQVSVLSAAGCPGYSKKQLIFLKGKCVCTVCMFFSAVARAFPGGRVAHPEGQNEEENGENLRKNTTI